MTCEPVQSLPPRPLASFWPLKLTAQLKVPELPDTTRQVLPTEEWQTPPSPLDPRTVLQAQSTLDSVRLCADPPHPRGAAASQQPG